jgi:hypothetical protein
MQMETLIAAAAAERFPRIANGRRQLRTAMRIAAAVPQLGDEIGHGGFLKWKSPDLPGQ